jgi:hypothetical protein
MSSTMIITNENVQTFISNVSSKFNISYDELMGMWNEQQSSVVPPQPVEVQVVSSGKCSAITKKGTQCTKNIVSNGRCNLHKLEVPNPVEQHKVPETEVIQSTVDITNVEVPSGKCSGVTKKGTQCTKNAVSNGRCNLHKLEVPKPVEPEINSEVVTPAENNQVLSNEFVNDSDLETSSSTDINCVEEIQVVAVEQTTTSKQQEDVLPTEQINSSDISNKTICDDSICTAVTKKGKQCTKKSVSNGKCKTHQNVTDEVEEEPKREPPKKLGRLSVHYRLGLIWDQFVTRFVFLKEDNKLFVIGRYSTKLDYLTEDDITLIKNLNLEYKNIDFLELAPQFPDKIEIPDEYQRIGETIGWNDQEFDNIISSIIIESLEKGECDVDTHVDKMLQRYRYTFFMHEANELRKLSHRLVRYHNQYTDLCSYMFLHKHEILNHTEISKNFTNYFVKKVTKILDEHSKYVKSCNLARYIKCIENMVPTYVPECLEFEPCEMLNKHILSVAVRISNIQTVVYSEDSTEPVNEPTSEITSEISLEITQEPITNTLSEELTVPTVEVSNDTTISQTNVEPSLETTTESNTEVQSVNPEPVHEDKPRRNVKNIVKSTKSFPKKKKQFKDHVDALREITEPVLEDPEIQSQ